MKELPVLFCVSTTSGTGRLCKLGLACPTAESSSLSTYRDICPLVSHRSTYSRPLEEVLGQVTFEKMDYQEQVRTVIGIGSNSRKPTSPHTGRPRPARGDLGPSYYAPAAARAAPALGYCQRGIAARQLGGAAATRVCIATGPPGAAAASPTAASNRGWSAQDALTSLDDPEGLGLDGVAQKTQSAVGVARDLACDACSGEITMKLHVRLLARGGRHTGKVTSVASVVAPRTFVDADVPMLPRLDGLSSPRQESAAK